MHVPQTFQTSFGRRLIAAPLMVPVKLTPAELERLASALDRDADLALAEGQILLSERLAWRAADLREAARRAT